MQNHHPQGPLAVELVEPIFKELPDELDIQSSCDSGWLTVSCREQTIARYLPVHGIAELDVHLVVADCPGTENEPDEVTNCLIESLASLRARGFRICHEYAEPLDGDHIRQTLVLRNSSVSEEEVVELAHTVLDANRYAIDLATDQDTVEKPSD